MLNKGPLYRNDVRRDFLHVGIRALAGEGTRECCPRLPLPHRRIKPRSPRAELTSGSHDVFEP